MRIVRAFPAGWALGLVLLAPQLASAAWDNVFQATCCHKRPTTAAYFAPTTAFFAPAPAPCCPTPCCPAPKVAFVQRSFYQPVTTFVAETHCEPVTSFKTSFFWEPVTSYSMSCYVDPCTGCPQQVATPTTSFRLRQQCNAVTSYVARVSYKPVTTFKQSFYMEAVAVDPCGQPAVTAAPSLGVGVPPVNTQPPPLNLTPQPGAGLNENRTMPPGGGAGTTDQSYMSPITSNPLSQRQPPAPPPPAPTIRPERVASRTSGMAVNGQVVRNDYVPRAGAKVVFVNASKQDVRQATTADNGGRFQVSLAVGRWYVYVDDANGQMTYHNQFDVQTGQSLPVTVVSR
jgi:hypothetical protein